MSQRKRLNVSDIMTSQGPILDSIIKETVKVAREMLSDRQMPLFDLASVTPKNGPPSTKFPFVRHLSDDDLAELNLVVQREINGRAP